MQRPSFFNHQRRSQLKPTLVLARGRSYCPSEGEKLLSLRRGEVELRQVAGHLFVRPRTAVLGGHFQCTPRPPDSHPSGRVLAGSGRAIPLPSHFVKSAKNQVDQRVQNRRIVRKVPLHAEFGEAIWNSPSPSSRESLRRSTRGAFAQTGHHKSVQAALRRRL